MTGALGRIAIWAVFYCPGNHDLWCVKGQDTWSEKMEGGLNSINKMLAIMDLCTEVGVTTQS